MTHLLRLALALTVGASLTASATLAETTIFAVTLTDGVVAPATLEVPAQAAVTLSVANTGTTPAEFESKRLHIERLVAPGETITIELPPLPAGSYPFVEEFHENLDTGRGEIIAK